MSTCDDSVIIQSSRGITVTSKLVDGTEIVDFVPARDDGDVHWEDVPKRDWVGNVVVRGCGPSPEPIMIVP